MLRLVGTAVSVERVSVLLTTDVETSTIGDGRLPSPRSSTEPSLMVTSTRALNPTARVKLLRTSVRKPTSEYSMRYTPAGRLPIRYAPWLSDMALCRPSSEGPDTSMVTPGNAAPVSSTIVPNTAPFCTVSCADNDRPAPMIIRPISTVATNDRIAHALGLMLPPTGVRRLPAGLRRGAPRLPPDLRLTDSLEPHQSSTSMARAPSSHLLTSQCE